jgi:hypothetical protein
MEEHRRKAGRDEGEDQVPAHLQELAQRADDEHVEGDDAGREGAIDQRAVDDEVYAPQVPAQDREAYGQWDEEHPRV